MYRLCIVNKLIFLTIIYYCNFNYTSIKTGLRYAITLSKDAKEGLSIGSDDHA